MTQLNQAPVAAAVATVPPRPRRRRRLPHGVAPYIFLAPYVLLLLGFGLGPIGYAVWTSLHRYDVEVNADVFTGLDNWWAVLTDDRLLTSTANVSKYLVVWLPAMLVLVLVIALLAHQRTGRFSTAVRLACYVPGSVAGSAAALMWLFMLTPGYSPFSPLLRAMGFESSSDTITPDSLPVVLSIIATAVTAGGWIVVLYAALNALPQDILEAARIDGANALQVALRVKLPLVKNYLSLMLISSFAYGTQLFVEPQVLKSAFTGQISQTFAINQLAYHYASQEGNFGQSAALSLMLMSVGVAVALIVIFKTNFYATDADMER
jgi:multiple sugar transport system permease protein